MSTEFGCTAWGHDWRRLAEPTSVTRPNPALPRARSLARNDQVGDLELRPGTVSATIEDRGRHHVHITVATWDDDQLPRAGAIVGAAPIGTDLPDSVHTELRHAGATSAPDPATVVATCTCAGRKAPCVHVLATYFDVARRLDERPRSATVLRGLTDAPAQDTARIPIGLLDPTTFYAVSTSAAR